MGRLVTGDYDRFPSHYIRRDVAGLAGDTGSLLSSCDWQDLFRDLICLCIDPVFFGDPDNPWDRRRSHLDATGQRLSILYKEHDAVLSEPHECY